MSSIFLSHNSKDKPFVRELAKRLSSDGITVWLDEAEISVGDSLIEKIAQGIQEMEFVGAIISKNSVDSEWVKKELSMAMSKEIKGKKIVVLPILIDSCQIPTFISDKLYADFREADKYDESYYTLLHAIQKHKAEIKSKVQSQLSITKNEIEDFVDVSVIGVDKQKTQLQSGSKVMYNVHLELSETPPAKWIEIFNGERNFPRHAMWRRVYIRGKHVIIECPLEELDKYHLRDVKEDLSNTNTKYRGVLFQEKQAKTRIEEELKRREDEKNSILDKIKI
jgi:hypothetical protein